MPPPDPLILRPTGWKRLGIATFLTIWLGGWAVGEAAMVRTAMRTFGAATPEWLERVAARALPEQPTGLFALLVFIGIALFWTFGGVIMSLKLTRLVAGHDELSLHGEGLEVRNAVGPFGRTRRYGRPLRVAIRQHDGMIVATFADTSEAWLSDFGSDRERAAARDWLRAAFGLGASEPKSMPLTPAWSETLLPDGTRVITIAPKQRRAGARWTLVVTLLVTGGYALYLRDSSMFGVGDVVTILAIGGLALGTLYSATAEEEWRVRERELTYRSSWVVRDVEDRFTDGWLAVRSSTDSEGDVSLTLEMIDGRHKRRLYSSLNSSADLLSLAAYLSRHTGFALEVPEELRDR